MATFVTRLHHGRFVLDDPTDDNAPRLNLVLEDEEEDLDPEDQARLDAFIDRSLAAASRGDVIPADVFLTELKKRRQR